MRSKKQTNLTTTLVALSDPTRRAILQRLAGGEARVSDLANPFAMSLNGVSKHIQVLERARLIRRRRAGREHLLSLDLTSLDEVAAWIHQQRVLWTARLDTLENLLRAEDREAARTRRKRRQERVLNG